MDSLLGSKYMLNSIAYRGAVPWKGLESKGKILWIGLGSVPTLSPSLKPLKSYTFMDFNFNVLAPQTINYRLRV